MVDDLEPHEEEEDISKPDPLGDALAGARGRPPTDPMSLPGMQNTSEPEFHPGEVAQHPFDNSSEANDAIWTLHHEDATPGAAMNVNPRHTAQSVLEGREPIFDMYTGEPKMQGTFKDTPFNSATGFTMGEPMELAWRLLKGDTIRKAWPEDSFADHSGFANPDGTPYEGDSEALMQQRIQEIADVHNMSLSDLYRVYDWEPDEHTGLSPEEVAQIEATDWDHPWYEDWDDLENAKLNWNSIKAHTNHMLDSGVKTIDGDHGPSGNSWTMGTTDPNWMETHADGIARKLEFYNDLYGHYTSEPTKHSTPSDKNPSLHWNPSLSQTHGSEWFDKKHFPNKNPLTDTRRWNKDHEGNWRRDMKNDPFRMKRPDIESEIEEMAAEMGRRRGRKDAVQEDKMNEEDPGLHGLDEHLRQNYFKNLFDRENPQNERLINVTAPQMREREELLHEELDRRAEKRRKDRV